MESNHQSDAEKNLSYWNQKPLLRNIYSSFYNLILNEFDRDNAGKIVELGSGIGNLKMAIPNCICTDQFPNPYIDQIENAYTLSFEENSIYSLILFDVFHHLQYPGSALNEFKRVLRNDGKLIIFDPDISLFSYIVYGIFHHEPVGLFRRILLKAPPETDFSNLKYYAAQGNASRIFLGRKYKTLLEGWKIKKIKRIASVSYIASGGYRNRQLYSDSLYPFMCKIDKICNLFPRLFSTRILIVMEKKVANRESEQNRVQF